MWMYFPREIEPGLSLKVHVSDSEKIIFIENDFELRPVRGALLQTKMEHLIHPLINWLRTMDALPADWQAIMQSALMCCPLLTVNLFDNARMPALVGWLGLMYAVHMGNTDVLLRQIHER
jgi:hypothetical protein